MASSGNTAEKTALSPSSVVRLAEELTELATHYPGSCHTDYSRNDLLARIIYTPPIGQDRPIVEFLLKRGYPSLVPEFLIQSRSGDRDTLIEALTKTLEVKGLSLVGQPMLKILVQEVDAFLASQETCIENKKCKENDFNLKGASNEERERNSEKKNRKATKKKRQRRNRINSDDSIDNSDVLDQALTQEKTSETSCDMSSFPTVIPRDHTGTLLSKPTHFLAVRFDAEPILKGLKEVQQCLVEKEPLLGKGVFALESLHMTMCTLGLETPDQVEHCVRALINMKSKLHTMWPQLPLVVHSMGQFYNRAIYAKVQCRDDFLNFRKELRKGLLGCGVEIRDEHEGFTPHVTIIKVKRPERRMFGSRNIQPSIYSHVLEKTFGQQTLEVLYLCSMDGLRRQDGFYTTLLELSKPL